MKIECNVDTCAHHANGVCYANGVDIVGGQASSGKDTCCSSFLDRAIYSDLTMNKAGSGDCDLLHCSVTTCRYQRGGHCHAESISIIGNGANEYRETACETFHTK